MKRHPLLNLASFICKFEVVQVIHTLKLCRVYDMVWYLSRYINVKQEKLVGKKKRTAIVCIGIVPSGYERSWQWEMCLKTGE